MNQLGLAAEQLAAEYLSQQGLSIIARNWRCRFGEIDLIAQQGKTLIFVEVRQRKNSRFGGAASSISAAKQGRLIRTAQMYLQSISPTPACRFDAVCIDGEQLTWLQDCIQAN